MGDVVDRYLDLAEKWGTAMENADPESANKLYKKLEKLYLSVATSGAEDRLLEHATTHYNDSVRFLLASRLADKAQAISLYKELAHSSLSFIAVSAEYILRELLHSRTD